MSNFNAFLGYQPQAARSAFRAERSYETGLLSGRSSKRRKIRAPLGPGHRRQAELASGAGGGDGKDIPPRWTVSEDEPFFGDGPFYESEVALAKSGVEASTLPGDIQEAMSRGAVTAKDITFLLKILRTPVLGWCCRMLPFIRDRVMGNPRFLLVLAIEEVIGVTAKTAAEIQGRKEAFWNELHFVASDIALEVIGDFAVVCLLSPKRSFQQYPKSRISRAISGLPGHAFQIGDYSLLQRVATVAYRGAQFFAVGFASSALGHGLTKWSIERERRKTPKKEGEEPYKPLAPVLDNSITWGGFMALSTNVRYQMINGIEERGLMEFARKQQQCGDMIIFQKHPAVRSFQSKLLRPGKNLQDALIQNEPLKAGITFLLRFGNTFAGGAQWVWYARFVGLQ